MEVSRERKIKANPPMATRHFWIEEYRSFCTCIVITDCSKLRRCIRLLHRLRRVLTICSAMEEAGMNFRCLSGMWGLKGLEREVDLHHGCNISDGRLSSSLWGVPSIFIRWGDPSPVRRRK